MQGVRELNRLAKEAKANREAHYEKLREKERRQARLQEEQEQAAMEAAERERLEMEREAAAVSNFLALANRCIDSGTGTKKADKGNREGCRRRIAVKAKSQSGEILTLMNRKFDHISEEIRATKVSVELLEYAVKERPTLTEVMDLLEDSRGKTQAIDLSTPSQKKALEDLFAASISQPHAIDLSHAAPKKALEDLLTVLRSEPHVIDLSHPSLKKAHEDLLAASRSEPHAIDLPHPS
jgi:hypothetical protein